HTSFSRDWSSDVCSSDLVTIDCLRLPPLRRLPRGDDPHALRKVAQAHAVLLPRRSATTASIVALGSRQCWCLAGRSCPARASQRSEERRVGKECGSRGLP